MEKLLSSVEAILDRPDLGKLILRLMVGGLLLLHGWPKLLGGTEWIQGQLAAHGLPSFIAYGVYMGEIVAPALLILGLLTRLSALVIAGNMIVAWLLVDLPKTFTLTQTGAWGIETLAFFFFGALAIALLGAGRFAVGRNSMWR